MNPKEYHLRKVLKITHCNNFLALTVSQQAVEYRLSPLRSALYVVHCALQHLPLYILHAPAFPSRFMLGTLRSISSRRTRRATFYIPFRADIRVLHRTPHSTLRALHFTPCAPDYRRPLYTHPLHTLRAGSTQQSPCPPLRTLHSTFPSPYPHSTPPSLLYAPQSNVLYI